MERESAVLETEHSGLSFGHAGFEASVQICIGSWICRSMSHQEAATTSQWVCRNKRIAERLIEDFHTMNLGGWTKRYTEVKQDGSWKDTTAFDNPKNTEDMGQKHFSRTRTEARFHLGEG